MYLIIISISFHWQKEHIYAFSRLLILSVDEKLVVDVFSKFPKLRTNYFILFYFFIFRLYVLFHNFIIIFFLKNAFAIIWCFISLFWFCAHFVMRTLFLDLEQNYSFNGNKQPCLNLVFSCLQPVCREIVNNFNQCKLSKRSTQN